MSYVGLCSMIVVQVNLSKTATPKKTKNVFQDKLSLNAGQKYRRMSQREHSAILLTFIKLPFFIKIFVCLLLSGPLRQVLLYLLVIYTY